MSLPTTLKGKILFAIVIGVLLFGVGGIHRWQTGGVEPVLAAEAKVSATFYYLPAIMKQYPWVSPFGIETTIDLGQNSALYQRAVELHPGWVRLNERISWRKLQLQRNCWNKRNRNISSITGGFDRWNQQYRDC